MPVVPDLVPREAPAAAVLAAPPEGRSYAVAILSIAASLLLGFLILASDTGSPPHWGPNLCPLGLLPGLIHLSHSPPYDPALQLRHAP